MPMAPSMLTLWIWEVWELMEQDNVLQAAVALALFYEPINNRVFPASNATAA